MGAAILMSHDQSCCSFEWVLEMHLYVSATDIYLPIFDQNHRHFSYSTKMADGWFWLL